MEEHETLPGFSRPEFEPMIFTDAAGNVIPYGDRWDDEDAPSESYDSSDHLERFAPIHDVADALIDHLVRTYVVARDENIAHLSELIRLPSGASRAVRLQPTDDTCTPVTLVFTDFPAVVGHAGWSLETFLPDCGCDACDETWESSADGLESWVDSVVNGHVVESFGPSAAGEHRTTIRDRDGNLIGERRSGGIDPELFVATPLREQDLPLTVSWKPWPRRADSPTGQRRLFTP